MEAIQLRAGPMVQYKPRQYQPRQYQPQQDKPGESLPTQDDLPETDFAPVDSELQVLAPSLLAEILAWYWSDRSDWFWGINMGIYYDLEQVSKVVVPDAFLSLGVEHFGREKGRFSYVLWQEKQIPILALEYVSNTYGGEYDAKMALYADIGVLYYVIYNPLFGDRKKRQPLEIYRLEDGQYVLQTGEPVWLPEVGLGLGCERGTYRNCAREWLYWYDQNGDRLTVPAEVAVQEHQRAEREAFRAEREAFRAEQEALRAEQEALRAEQEALRASQEAKRADQAAKRADQEALKAAEAAQKAEQERQLREALLEKLRQQGIDPELL